MALLEELLAANPMAVPTASEPAVAPPQFTPQNPGLLEALSAENFPALKAPTSIRVKEAAKDFAGNFLFTLGQALKGSATAPAGRGTQAGMGAAFQAPMVLQQMREEQARQQQEDAFKAAKFVSDIKQQGIQNALAQRQADISAGNLAVNQRQADLEQQRLNQPKTLPEKIQEYNLYAQQEKAAGRVPKGFVEYQQMLQKPPAAANLQQKQIQNPENPKLPLLANFNPDTGVTTHPATGAVIKNPQPFFEPKAEAGSYMPYTDQRGQVLYWVNPKTREKVTPEDMGIKDDMYKGAISMDRQTREAAAASGLKAIADFRAELKKNPNLLTQLAVPGSPGARIAAAARKEMIDVLTRIRTGAALNRDEQSFYDSQAPSLLDTLFDNPETVEYKLGIFERNFQGLAPQKKVGAEAGNNTVSYQGKTYKFPSKAAADGFKKEMGIK